MTEKQFAALCLVLSSIRHGFVVLHKDLRTIGALERRGLFNRERGLTRDGEKLFKSELLHRLPPSKHLAAGLLVDAGFLQVRRLETPKIVVGPKDLRFLAAVNCLRRFKGGWTRGYELTERGEGYLEA